MATYHCTVKVGAKGKGAAHACYIAREGKYENLRSGEKLEYVEHGNMPEWAEHNGIVFWESADQFERANGAAYREIEVALPRELTPEQRVELVQDFVKQELGDKHAYTFAIHNPRAALDRGEQPHAHIMYSERLIDTHERDPDQYFKRYNAKEPERGGCQKANFEKTADERKEALVAQRERWAVTTNKHLELCGHETRVDHRSLKDQGIERDPERHLGGPGVRRLSEHDISQLLEYRKAEGEKEREHKILRSEMIDLSGDLEAAKQERDARLQREAEAMVAQGHAEVMAEYALHKSIEEDRKEAMRGFEIWRAEEALKKKQELERQDLERYAADLKQRLELEKQLEKEQELEKYSRGKGLDDDDDDDHELKITRRRRR